MFSSSLPKGLSVFFFFCLFLLFINYTKINVMKSSSNQETYGRSLVTKICEQENDSLLFFWQEFFKTWHQIKKTSLTIVSFKLKHFIILPLKLKIKSKNDRKQREKLRINSKVHLIISCFKRLMKKKNKVTFTMNKIEFVIYYSY